MADSPYLPREASMSTIKASSYRDIEVSLVQKPGRYLVSVVDSEGLLHQTEFRFATKLSEVSEREGEAYREAACAEALEWYETVQSCIDKYIQRPTSESIRSLTSFLH